MNDHVNETLAQIIDNIFLQSAPPRPDADQPAPARPATTIVTEGIVFLTNVTDPDGRTWLMFPESTAGRFKPHKVEWREEEE